MVILCSDLPNDQSMIKALGKDAYPLPLFTDACFSGVGENGTLLLVAVERKLVEDLVKCINDGRLVRQLQRAKENNADVFVLIVEGAYKCDHGFGSDGLLVIPRWSAADGRPVWVPVKPVMTFSRFEQYLFELDWLAGAVVKRSNDVRQTADIIKALYTNFQTEPDRHQSLRKFYYAPPPIVPLQEPGLVRRVAKEIKGIGWERSKTVAEHFPSVKAMCEADVGEWSKLPGIGKKTARVVVETLQGG